MLIIMRAIANGMLPILFIIATNKESPALILSVYISAIVFGWCVLKMFKLV